MKKLFYLRYIMALCMTGMMVTACDNIDEADRLIYVEPESVDPVDDNGGDDGLEMVRRVVLLEDFTGQRCINCPLGTEIIEQLQEEYGDTAFIAVGIHSGPLGFKGNARTLGLATDLGDEYYNHWGFEYQPIGLVNRQGGASNYTDWIRAVNTALTQTASLTLDVTATLNGGKLDITVDSRGVNGDTQGKLQLWIVEDGITAMQLMPDGDANADYVHNHVLRAAVNGAWGDDFSLAEGATDSRNYTGFALDEAWNVQRLRVVAFVYNDDGVQQAAVAGVE